MYLKLFCILTLIIVTNLSCAAQKQETGKTAIAFYNIENLFDPADDPATFDDAFTPGGSYRYTDAIYRKKIENISVVLSRLATEYNTDGPAIIGLAEVENRKVLEDLVNTKNLKQRKLAIVHFDSPDPRGIDVALLYHPKQFTLIRAKAIPVPNTTNNRNTKTRDILYATGRTGHDTLHLLVNHWPSRRDGENNTQKKRKAVAEINRKIIDSVLGSNPNARIIVMGDLNDNPLNKSITQSLKAIPDKSDTNKHILYNPWNDLYRKGYGTSVYKSKWMLFDQIIISKALLTPAKGKLHYDSVEIFNRRFLCNSFGKNKDFPHRSFNGTRWIDGFSDHFPVLLYLCY